MKVNIIRSEFLDIEIYNKLESLLAPFSTSITFTFHQGTFSEPDSRWTRDNLILEMQNFRQCCGFDANDFVIFLTTKRDKENWFSACLQDWQKIFLLVQLSG